MVSHSHQAPALIIDAPCAVVYCEAASVSVTNVQDIATLGSGCDEAAVAIVLSDDVAGANDRAVSVASSDDVASGRRTTSVCPGIVLRSAVARTGQITVRATYVVHPIVALRTRRLRSHSSNADCCREIACRQQ